MKSENAVILGVALAFVAIGIVVGLVAGSWLAVALIAASPLLVLVGAALVDDHPVKGWVLIALGFALMGVATWWTGMDGGWLWALPWAVLGVVGLGAGSAVRDDRPAYGDTLMALGAVGLAMAVLGPLLMQDLLAGARPEGAGGVGAGVDFVPSLSPLGDFLSSVFTSFWGYVSLLLAFLIGVSWWRNRGGLVALFALPLAALVVGAFDEGAARLFCDWLAAGPIEQFAMILRGSQEQWGTAGWGIYITGPCIMMLAAGGLRHGVRGNRVLAESRTGVGLGVSSESQALLARNVDTWSYSAGQFVLLGALLVAPILLWLALRRVSGGVALPFDAIRMPDLARPNFRPVWDPSYFVLAAVGGALAVIIGRVYKRLHAAIATPVVGNPVWQVAAALIGAMLIPGGVVLMSTITAAAMLVILPIAAAVALRRPLSLEAVREGATGSAEVGGATGAATNMMWLMTGGRAGGSDAASDEEPVWRSGLGALGAQDDGEEDEDARGTTREELEPTHEPEPEPTPKPGPEPRRGPKPESRLLADAGAPLAGIVAAGTQGDDDLVTITAKGELQRWRDGSSTVSAVVPAVRPLGLAAASGGRVFFVEAEGRILDVELGDEGYEIRHSCAPGKISCFAANPLGTLVAYGQPGRDGLSGFIANTDKTRVLDAGVPAPVALAFSFDGIQLALGAADGSLRVFDVARSEVTELEGAGAGSAVALLAPAPSSGWVAVFDDKRLSLWDADGTVARSLKLPAAATALAVDRESGRVALGGSRGTVRVRSADLTDVLVDESVHSGKVRWLAFAGGRLLSAGDDGTVRAIEM